MVDPTLVQFIRQYMQQGYDLGTIQQHLTQQGYQQKDIQEAVSVIYGAPQVKHTIDFSKKTIILLVVICIFIVVGGIVGVRIFTGGSSVPTLLDLRVSSVSEEIEAGEPFVFQYEATQTGSKKRFDFQLVHTILDTRNRKITSKQEEVAVETKVSGTASIPIPSDTASGKYILKSVAQYDGKTATARLEFRVGGDEGEENKGDEEDEENKGGEDETPLPDDEDQVGQRDDEEDSVDDTSTSDTEDDPGVIVPVIPSPTVPTQASNTVIDKALEESTRDVNKAGKLCDGLSELRKRDTCFEKIAEQAQQTTLCASIQSNSKRDTCYMNFAIEGDFSVCPKVENPYLKRSCESLAALNG